MKTLRFLPLVALGIATVFNAGCSDSTAAATADSATDLACTYKAGHGVQLSAAAQDFAGLTTTEVTAREDFSVSVPRSAILPTAHGPAVFVANGDWFLRTPVTLGPDLAGDHVTINDGLYEGDLVAVGGLRVLALAEIQAVNGGVGCADGH